MSKSLLRPKDQCKSLFQDLARLTHSTLRVVIELLARADYGTVTIDKHELAEACGYPYGIIIDALDELVEAKLIVTVEKADQVKVRFLISTVLRVHTKRATEDARAREEALIGAAPTNLSPSLPEALQEYFASEGKEEVWPNVWLHKAEITNLRKLYPDHVLEEAGESLYHWSISTSVSPKSAIPHWKSYRCNRNHFELLGKKLAQMQRARA